MSIQLQDFYCPICDCPTLAPMEEFWFCHTCRVWIRIQPNVIEINNRYKNSWDSPEINHLETGGTYKHFAKKYVQRLCQELNLLDMSGLKILDFGAGRGMVARELEFYKADVFGFEPFGYMHLKNIGIKVYKELKEIPEGLMFDGITNIDVIEHVENPIQTFRWIFEHLKPRGWLFTATPNNQSLNARISRSEWRETKNPGHLCLFSSRGLELALKKAGFNNSRRLKWFIDYSNRPEKIILNRFLTSIKLDGELRYLSTKQV